MTKIYRVQMNSNGMPNFSTAVEIADRPRGEVDAVKEYEHQVHNLDQGYITLGEFDKRIEPLRHLHYDRPQGEWIPCSERLPSEQGEYLVTVTYEGDTYVECLHYGKPTMANREVKGECFYDSDDEWGDIVYDTEAIAWMPLPKPYGEREGE